MLSTLCTVTSFVLTTPIGLWFLACLRCFRVFGIFASLRASWTFSLVRDGLPSPMIARTSTSPSVSVNIVLRVSSRPSSISESCFLYYMRQAQPFPCPSAWCRPLILKSPVRSSIARNKSHGSVSVNTLLPILELPFRSHTTASLVNGNIGVSIATRLYRICLCHSTACILSLPRRSGIADWSPGEKCQCILSAATPLPEGRSRSNINISVRWTLVERTLFDPIGTYHIMVSNKNTPIIHDTINRETHYVTIVSIDTKLHHIW